MNSEQLPNNLELRLAQKAEQIRINKITEQFIERQSEILSRPEKLHSAVDTLFNQFSIDDASGQGTVAFTPDLPVEIKKGSNRPEIPITALYLSRIDKKSKTYAIFSKTKDGFAALDLPMFLFKKCGKSSIVLNSDNKKVNDEVELKNVRDLIDMFKSYYHYSVLEYANSIGLAEELYLGDSTFSVQNDLAFYFSNMETRLVYPPIHTEFDKVGDAFVDAIEECFKKFGNEPTPQKDSPIRLAKLSIIVDGNEKLIDPSRLSPIGGLQRELTTFDSDAYEMQKIWDDLSFQNTVCN